MAVLEIRGPGPHKGTEGGLRCAVDTEGRRTCRARDRAVENDRSTIIHERKGLLYREQRSLDVDIEKFVEMLLSDFAERSKFRNAGIGVKFPLCFDSLIKTIEVVQFGNVSLNASDVATDCLHGLFELFLPTARDQDVPTLF